MKQGTKDEMIGWHHRLNDHELEEAPGVSKEQETWLHRVTKSQTRLND